MRNEARSRCDVEGAEELGQLFGENEFSVLQVNIQGLVAHAMELSATLGLMAPMPDVICINETWLDKAVGGVDIDGYTCVARRDRRDGRKCGGIASYARHDIKNLVTQLEESKTAERHWLVVHGHRGPLLLGNWYRPPSRGETDSITSMKREWELHSSSVLGTILVGDMNVHQISWLRHSSGDTPEGRELQAQSGECNFRQMVRSPTRGEYLLDLVLSDLEGLKCEVIPVVADHRLVHTKMKFSVPKVEHRERVVWDFRLADWDGLFAELEVMDWEFIASSNVDVAARELVNVVLEAAQVHIPRRVMLERKSTHGWLTPHVIEMTRKKRAAAGTTEEASAAADCSAAILEAFASYTARTKQKLQSLQRGSKAWWRLARSVSLQASPLSSVPALKTSNGT